jgi:hypothetical protein
MLAAVARSWRRIRIIKRCWVEKLDVMGDAGQTLNALPDQER